jgi:hypothetical protein
VAIKKISNPFAVPLEAKRLLREIRLLRMLRHPNIIAIKARAGVPALLPARAQRAGVMHACTRACSGRAERPCGGASAWR